MINKNEVEEFINRRFTVDCNWTTGNCYWFAKILADRFWLKIYYLPIEGHFVAGDGQLFFDFNGEYIVKDEPILNFDELETFDKLQYDRLVRDCIV